MPVSPPQLHAATLEKAAARGKTWRPWAAVLFLLALAGMIWGSLTPQPPTVDVSNFDKVQHFAAYAGLAGLAFLTLRRPAPWAAAALVALGVGLELVQVAMALGREGSPIDALANSGGVALAWLLASRGGRKRRKSV